MSLCFEAPAVGGPLRLVLGDQAHSTPPDALTAALALAPCEPLLQALEAWWQTALDPQPVDNPPDHPSTSGPWLWLQAAVDAGAGGANRAANGTPSNGPSSVSLGLPWAQLLAAAPPTTALPWIWPTLAWRVVLATYPHNPLPAGPVTGGALLLPPAFEGAWRVQLRCAEPALQAEAEWAGPGHPLQLCGPPEAAAGNAQADAPWWVELRTTWTASLPQLLGWAPLPTEVLGDQACLHGAVPPGHTGTVAPALGGAALWLHGADGHSGVGKAAGDGPVVNESNDSGGGPSEAVAGAAGVDTPAVDPLTVEARAWT